MTKAYQPHQLRVINEQTELEIKLKGLREFIRNNAAFQTLPKDEQLLMKTQMDLMAAYSNILGMRIAKF